MDSPATRHQDTAGGRRRSGAAVEFARVVRAAHPEQVGHLRHEARRWLTDLGLPEAEQESVLLAVNEAVENAVEHAYADEDEGVVELTLWAEPGIVNVAVVDHGRWREPGEDDAAAPAEMAGPVVTDVDSFADAYADATAGPDVEAGDEVPRAGVGDAGPGDPVEAPTSGEESAVVTHGARGRGIVLMHRSVDSVAIRHDAAGTAVLLRHHRQS